MTSPKNKKIKEHLLPGEQIIDCLKFTSFYRGSEFVLTDQRLLVSGYTGSLGPSFTLLRGTMVAGFPLIEFESFVIGTGKRPMLLFTSLALVVAGGVMASFAYTRYSGLGFCLCPVLLPCLDRVAPDLCHGFGRGGKDIRPGQTPGDRGFPRAAPVGGLRGQGGGVAGRGC